MENEEPFGREMRGRSHVYVTKDRPGHLRRHGQPTKVPQRTYLREFVVDDSQTVGPDLILGFYAPRRAAEREETAARALTDGRRELDDAVWQVVADIVAVTGRSATTNAITARAEGRRTDVRDALERLTLDGRVIREDGKNRTHLYRAVTPSASPSASQDHIEGES